ncbi:glycosyl transferase family 1 [Rhodopirellula sp. SM50]|nr:glycosyl transferase family 1 [Rhodopirellula sp. SM50]
MVLSEVFPPQKGGSGNWLWEIYKRQTVGSYLMAVGNSQGDDPRDAEYPQQIERLNLAMPFRGISRFNSLGHYSRQIRLIRRLVRRRQVKLIHASRPLSEGLVARSVKFTDGIPYLCYVHGEDVNVAMSSRELKLLTQNVLKHASAIVANSSFTRQLLLSDWSIPAEKIILMHPGVDTDYFVPAEGDHGRPKSWTDKTVLMTVGRLQARKGHDTVIRALSELIHELPNLHYVIVGGGEERASLERLADSLEVAKHVEFVGEIDALALRQYYQHCDLFVLANRTIGRDVEGFGMVLLEAQACGKPVIAGASGGTIDTMRVGLSGNVIDCNTTQQLTKTIRSLAGDRTRLAQMGQAGRQHVVERFAWPSLARQAHEAFRSIGSQ